MNDVKALEKRRDKLKRDYKKAMELLGNELTDILNEFRDREMKTMKNFETRIEKLTQQIINEYKSITIINERKFDEYKSIINSIPNMSIDDESILPLNMNSNPNRNQNKRKVKLKLKSPNNMFDNDDRLLNFDDRIANFDDGIVNFDDGIVNFDDKLLNFDDKSTYKKIVRDYCEEYRIPFPIEITNIMSQNSNTYFESTILHDNLTGKIKINGYGIKKKDAIYDGYMKLIPIIMNINEANSRLMKYNNNINPKGILMQYSSQNHIQKPETKYKVTFDKNMNKNLYTAMVSFMGVHRQATSVRKKDAEQQACKQIQETLFYN